MTTLHTTIAEPNKKLFSINLQRTIIKKYIYLFVSELDFNGREFILEFKVKKLNEKESRIHTHKKYEIYTFCKKVISVYSVFFLPK